MNSWVIIFTALAYLSLLFAIASWGDKRRKRSAGEYRPMIYSLSLAVYCTSWTFFGSVGLASERGLEFLTIYIGPILVYLFGHRMLRRILRVSKAERITSIADFLAARYGKSFSVAALATVIATVGTVPYIALQLKAVSGSIELMIAHESAGASIPIPGDMALTVAALLALFAILFGTRHADATEHQDGMVLAIAVESVIKLVAFLAIGVAVTFFMFDTPKTLLDAMQANERVQAALTYETSPTTWIVMTMLSGMAILMLPRQFYISVVENRSERELDTATWLFPLYLVLINIFVLPIAFAGITTIGNQASADLYVLAIPLVHGSDVLALVSLIGGLSAATAMVIVASVALSIMISNDLVIPVLLKRAQIPTAGEKEDWSRIILNVRRAAICLILVAALLYYREIANNIRLASIGLLSFAALAQFAPAFFGALLWRGANARGAVMGMSAGILVWGYTLLLPSFLPDDAHIITDGLWGFTALRPEALFGVEAEPLNHGVLWSLAANTLFFIMGCLSRAATPRERIQAAIFVPRESAQIPGLRRFRTAVTNSELKDTISRYLGAERTERSFQTFEQNEGRKYMASQIADAGTIRFAEQLLASAVGSSSARLILSLLFQRVDANSRNAYRLLDDASEALQQNRDLLQIALDQMEDGITVYDQDFGLSCWNRQFRTLFDLPDELGQVGTSISKVIDYLVRRGDIAKNDEETILERLTVTHATWQMELLSTGRIIEVRSNPMPNGGVVASYADITDRVKADLALKRANETLEQRVAARTAELLELNEELAQAQRLAEEANLGKTRFLAGAGHDILQPLNAARLYCSALKESIADQATRSALSNIDSSLDSVETILGAVLDISRLDTGAMKPKESIFRLDSMLEQLRNDFTPAAREKALELTIVPSSLNVETDRNLLRRVLQNLVSNAIKYTRSGKVLVGVRRRGRLCEIQVIDTGIGIRADKLNTVFREFTRLDEGAREAEGLGLGLSIVDRIARVLRLEIRIWSEPGKGTRFSVLIPVTQAEQDAVAAPAATAQAARGSLTGTRVLCIDNDMRILDGMRMLLENWGCEVIAHAGAAEFEAAFDRNGLVPDVIVADFHLDGATGFDAITSIHERLGRNVPAIMLTANRSDEVKAAAEERQIPLLYKPVKPAALRTALNRSRKMLPKAAE
ncbi:NahK/ErcS family hybrid sensor histidine kinase/response regulator [Zhengella sp. ZM62]|uniref:PAS domain-containing hybrid sensor histidine kinase/response regulator n=1 Tax=Zhengella sedimenti TaxID=3390035 RepID=UPI0039759D5E